MPSAAHSGDGPAAVASRVMTVGDSGLSIRLVLEGGRLSEAAYHVAGEVIRGMWAEPWVVEVDSEVWRAGDDQSRLVSAGPREARFAGGNLAFSWELVYQLLGASRITKTLTVTPRHGIVVRRVWLWAASWTEQPVISRTGVQVIAALYRQGSVGLFASLDFPYSQIVCVDGVTTVGYPPHERVAAGTPYRCHSLTIGATSVSGRVRHGYHEGEVEAIDRYVQERFPPRSTRPLFSSASISNRFTQLEGDWVFYCLQDQPSLCAHRDLLKRELALMPRLGMEYYQVFPGVFDWGPDDPSPAMVHETVGWARANGLRMGDYSGANVLFCGHYNRHRNSLDRPEWRMLDSEGNALAFCLGNEEFVDLWASKVVSTAREFGFELHALDFLSLAPCHATDHGHPPGPESIYSQVRGLVRFMDAVNDVSPAMLVWPNSGDWAELLPKLAWYAPSLYLTDPHVSTPWQGLNQTRILDDSRREQMVNLHYSRFVPYRFFTNCQYFFCQNSVVPDARAHYEYGALSTLAVTPNLCLAEVRPWLDRQSPETQARVESFYAKWTGFIKEQFALWTRTYHVCGDPAPGAVEIYGHADGEHGFVFIVNPQYWGRTVEVPLDESLGFSGSGGCQVAELYPLERLRLTRQGPLAEYGTRLPVHVDAQQVLILEVRPAPGPVSEPQLHGLPGTVETEQDRYVVKVRGLQGTHGRFALLTPDGSPPIRSVTVQCVLPRQDERQPSATPVTLVASDHRGALVDITFPRDPAPAELREWTVRAGSLAEGSAAGWHEGLPNGEAVRLPLVGDAQSPDPWLPGPHAASSGADLGPLASFCGAYVENAFSEVQEAWLSLAFGDEAEPSGPRGQPRDGGPGDELASDPFASPEALPEAGPLGPLATDDAHEWWLQTRFSLPFMYGYGCEPAFDDHTILVFPLLPQPGKTTIAAWANGVPLEVRRYSYPRNRALGCFYADLVGTAARHGDNILTVHYALERP